MGQPSCANGEHRNRKADRYYTLCRGIWVAPAQSQSCLLSPQPPGGDCHLGWQATALGQSGARCQLRGCPRTQVIPGPRCRPLSCSGRQYRCQWRHAHAARRNVGPPRTAACLPAHQAYPPHPTRGVSDGYNATQAERISPVIRDTGRPRLAPTCILRFSFSRARNIVLSCSADRSFITSCIRFSSCSRSCDSWSSSR